MIALHKTLSGHHAFYEQPIYNELNATIPLNSLKSQADYIVQVNKNALKTNIEKTQNVWQNFIHKTLGSISFILGHIAACFLFFSQCFNGETKFDTNFLGMLRFNHFKEIKNKGFEINRLRVDIHDISLDVFIIGRKKNLANGKWTVHFGGLGEPVLENSQKDLLQFCEETKSNLVLFNYAGYGASSSTYPSLTSYINSCKAIVTMLQDEKMGLKARKICFFGYSLGGGLIGALLSEYPEILSKKIKYLIIKDRSFSSLEKAAGGIFKGIPIHNSLKTLMIKISNFFKNLAQKACWQFSSTESSKKQTEIVEIVLQQAKNPKLSAKNFKPYILKHIKNLTETDLVISKKSTMAFSILSDKTYPKRNKVILGIPENHFDTLGPKTIHSLASRVNKIF